MMNWEQLLSQKRVGKKIKNTNSTDRSAFEQDYDRIIFSHPFRRLQDKTQVFPLPEYDFVHTRLTHSIEVSSVGRSLGKLVGEAILAKHSDLQKKYSVHDFGAIVAAAALTHDIGNPPFGHSGENAISDFFIHNPKGAILKKHVSKEEWADLTNFEGNAQGFRILNKPNYQGLRLTYATLAAFSKYPKSSSTKVVDPSRKSQKKYGFFQSEKEIFKSIAEDMGLISLTAEDEPCWCRHPLTFLVEAADDICYSIIDLEDGCRLGLVSYEEVKELFAQILGSAFQPNKLEKIEDQNEKVGLLRALVINTLIKQCTEVFLSNEDELLNGSFDKALTDQIPSSEILEKITSLSINKIYKSRAVLEAEAAGFEVINGILEDFVTACYEVKINGKKTSNKQKSLILLLPNELQQIINDKDTSMYNSIMLCIDYISGMTDKFAISLYRKIKGIALPGT